MIQMTRVTVSKLKEQKSKLQKDIKRLEGELVLKDRLTNKMKIFEKDYEILNRICKFLMEELNDENCRRILEKHGFHDDWFSLREYRDSLAQVHDEIIDINRELENFFKYKPVIEESSNEPDCVESNPKNDEDYTLKLSPTAMSDFFFSNPESEDYDK